MPDQSIPAAPAPAAPSSAGAPPAPTPAPTPSSPEGGAPPSDNIRQLREAYEGIKRDFEPWQKLGVKPEQVVQFQGTYQRVFQEVAAIGRELGYPDDEILEALHEDPVRTLDYLRSEAARVQEGQAGQAGQGQDLSELVSQQVAQALGPIQQRENVRMTNEANALFERTVHGLAVEAFKQEGLDAAQVPPDEMNLLASATSEILKYDDEALRALKYEGKTAAIQKAFVEARTMLDKYYVARAGRDRARPAAAGARPGAPAAPPGKKPSLDDIINDPSVLGKQYA